MHGGAHAERWLSHLWVLGHLAYIEALIIRNFMLGGPSPLAHWEGMFDGADVSDHIDDFVPFDAALTECRTTRASTMELLNSLEENDLDQMSANVPGKAGGLLGTYRKCFQYSADHWFMHRGQLADARQAAGLELMWY